MRWPRDEAVRITSLSSLLTAHRHNSQRARRSRRHGELIYYWYSAVKWESLRCYAIGMCQWWHFNFMLAARSLTRFMNFVLHPAVSLAMHCHCFCCGIEGTAAGPPAFRAISIREVQVIYSKSGLNVTVYLLVVFKQIPKWIVMFNHHLSNSLLLSPANGHTVELDFT